MEYDEKVTRFYNANEITKREWVYKYNDDPEFVAAVGKVIELARRHLKDLPENIACPPGCAECCSGYEPFVSKADVVRIAAAPRNELRGDAAPVRRRTPVGRRFSRRMASQSRRRPRRPVRLSHGIAQRPALLRHLRRPPARLPRFHANRVRRRGYGPAAKDDLEDWAGVPTETARAQPERQTPLMLAALAVTAALYQGMHWRFIGPFAADAPSRSTGWRISRICSTSRRSMAEFGKAKMRDEPGCRSSMENQPARSARSR